MLYYYTCYETFIVQRKSRCRMVQLQNCGNETRGGNLFLLLMRFNKGSQWYIWEERLRTFHWRHLENCIFNVFGRRNYIMKESCKWVNLDIWQDSFTNFRTKGSLHSTPSIDWSLGRYGRLPSSTFSVSVGQVHYIRLCTNSLENLLSANILLLG